METFEFVMILGFTVGIASTLSFVLIILTIDHVRKVKHLKNRIKENEASLKQGEETLAKIKY